MKNSGNTAEESEDSSLRIRRPGHHLQYNDFYIGQEIWTLKDSTVYMTQISLLWYVYQLNLKIASYLESVNVSSFLHSSFIYCFPNSATCLHYFLSFLPLPLSPISTLPLSSSWFQYSDIIQLWLQVLKILWAHLYEQRIGKSIKIFF